MTPSIAAQRTKHILRHLNRTLSAMPTPAQAPWREAFLNHVNDMDEPSFTLSTLHPVDESVSGHDVTPRARTVIFRGMWTNLTPNPKNPASLNPSIFETDLPTITSDSRMEKIPELFRSAPEAAAAASEPQSRRGGPVEAVFWIPKSRVQWRLRGYSYIIGPDIDTDAAAPVRDGLSRYTRRTGDGSEEGDAASWSWSRELTAHFGNLNPMMRGSFRNPPPGTPKSQAPGKGEGLGQKVEDLDDEVARRNFRVLVIVPEEVDQVNVSNTEDGGRWSYRLEDGGSWKMTELWP